MTVYCKNGRWYYNFMIDGERFHKSIKGCTSHKDALKVENVVKTELMRSNYELVEKVKTTTLQEAVDLYKEYSKANKKSYELDVLFCRVFIEVFGKNTKLKDITPQKIERFKGDRMTKNSNATVNRYLEALSKLFNLAISYDLAKENPMTKVKKLRQKNYKIRFLTKDEEKRLFEVLEKNEQYWHLKPIILCSLLAGMRYGEIINLKWHNVDFHTNHIELLETKSGKARKIPISNKLMNELLKLKVNKHPTLDYIFINPATDTKYIDVKKGYRNLLKKAEISNFRFHDLRHTAATRMTEMGIDLAVVQEILGHSDIKTTMRYAHPVPERKLKAIEALDNYVE